MQINVISEYVNFSRTSIEKYVKKILGKQFNKDVFDKYLSLYIEKRYYSFYPRAEKTFSYSIAKELWSFFEENGSLKEEENTLKSFRFVMYFDNVKESDSMVKIIEELLLFRENDLGIVDDKFSKEIFDMVRDDLLMKKEYIDKFYVENFGMNFYLTDVENLYDSFFESKIKFPRLYDKNSINKVFNSKDVSEDRLFVEYCYLAAQVLLDAIEGDFKKQYLIGYTDSLINKKNKDKHVMNAIDNDLAKEKIVLKINYADFLENKENYYAKMRVGFKFAAILDEKFKGKEDEFKLLEAFTYVMMSKKSSHYERLAHNKNVVTLK